MNADSFINPDVFASGVQSGLSGHSPGVTPRRAQTPGMGAAADDVLRSASQAVIPAEGAGEGGWLKRELSRALDRVAEVEDQRAKDEKDLKLKLRVKDDLLRKLHEEVQARSSANPAELHMLRNSLFEAERRISELVEGASCREAAAELKLRQAAEDLAQMRGVADANASLSAHLRAENEELRRALERNENASDRVASLLHENRSLHRQVAELSDERNLAAAEGSLEATRQYRQALSQAVKEKHDAQAQLNDAESHAYKKFTAEKEALDAKVAALQDQLSTVQDESRDAKHTALGREKERLMAEFRREKEELHADFQREREADATRFELIAEKERTARESVQQEAVFEKDKARRAQEEVQRVTLAKEKLERDADRLRDDLRSTTKKLREAQGVAVAAESLRRELDDVQAQHERERETWRVTADTDRETARMEISKQQQEIETARVHHTAEVESLNRAHARDIELSLDGIKRECQALQDTAARATAENESLHAALEASQRDLETSRADLAGLQDAAAALKTKGEALADDKDALERRVQALITSKEATERRADGLAKDHSLAAAQVRELEDALRAGEFEMEARTKERHASLQQLEDSLQEYKRGAEEERRKDEGTIRSLQHAREDLIRQGEDLQRQVALLKASEGQLETTLGELRRREEEAVASLQSRLGEREREASELRQKNMFIDRDLAATKDALQETARRAEWREEELQAALKALQGQKDSTEAQDRQRWDRREEEHEQRCQSLKHAADEYRTRSEDLARRLGDAERLCESETSARKNAEANCNMEREHRANEATAHQKHTKSMKEQHESNTHKQQAAFARKLEDERSALLLQFQAEREGFAVELEAAEAIQRTTETLYLELKPHLHDLQQRLIEERRNSQHAQLQRRVATLEGELQKTTDDLVAAQSAFRQERDGLMDEVAMLKQVLERNSQSSERDRSITESEAQRVRERNQQLTAQLNEAELQVNDLEGDLRQQRMERQRDGEELKRLKDGLDSVRVALDSERADNRAVQQAAEQQQQYAASECKGLKERLHDAHDHMAELQRDLADEQRKAVEAEGLRQKLTEKEEEVASVSFTMGKRLEGTRRKMDMLLSEINTLQGDNDLLKKQLRVYESDIAESAMTALQLVTGRAGEVGLS